MESSETRFQFGPPIRSVFLGGLRHAQAGFLLVGFGSSVLFLRFVPGQIGVGIAMLTMVGGVAGAFGTIEGRPFDDWVPASSHWAMIVLGRKRRWRSDAPGQGQTMPVAEVAKTHGRAARKAAKQSPPPPARDWQLIYTSVSGQTMGVLRDKKAKSWVAVIGVQGQSFMLLDESEQVRRLASWAAVQASMARQGSPISRMQWLERTLTEVGDEMRAFFDERARSTNGTAANKSYADLLVSAQPVTQQHETYLVLQVTASKAARAIKHAGGGDRGAVAVLYRELEHLQRRLRESDLTVGGFLSGDELALLMRTQFDPEDALALSAHQARSSEPLVSARSAWPMATEVSWGHYRTDNIYHITYWISEWPKLGVRPSFLAPLLLTSNGVTRTISLVAEPIPTAQAVKKVEHQQTARLSDDEIRSGAGYRTGARRRREGEALDRRENELADGHAENRYSGYVTVSGSDLHEVEVAAATIEQVAYQCPVELRRLWGEQDTAFYSTMPMARGLA